VIFRKITPGIFALCISELYGFGSLSLQMSSYASALIGFVRGMTAIHTSLDIHTHQDDFRWNSCYQFRVATPGESQKKNRGSQADCSVLTDVQLDRCMPGTYAGRTGQSLCTKCAVCALYNIIFSTNDIVPDFDRFKDLVQETCQHVHPSSSQLRVWNIPDFYHCEAVESGLRICTPWISDFVLKFPKKSSYWILYTHKNHQCFSSRRKIRWNGRLVLSACKSWSTEPNLRCVVQAGKYQSFYGYSTCRACSVGRVSKTGTSSFQVGPCV